MSEEKDRMKELEDQVRAMDTVEPLDTPPEETPAEEPKVQANGNEGQDHEPKPEAETEGDPKPANPEPEEGEREDDKLTEEEEKELLEADIENPQAIHFKKLRGVTKRFKTEAEAMKSRIAELEQKVASEPAREPTPGASQEQAQGGGKQLSPDDVMMAVARARNDEFENSAEVLRRAKAVIESNFTPRQLHEFLQKAESKQFGEYSDDLAMFISEEGPKIMLAQAARQESEREQQSQLQEQQNAIVQSAQRVIEKYPELKDQQGEQRRALDKFIEENVGTLDAQGNLVNPGPLANMLLQPDWPERVADLFKRVYKPAPQRQEVNAPAAESAGSGGGGNATQKGGTRLQELEQKLRSYGKVGTLT